MFVFVIRYFGFLKFVPGLALLFDAQLKLWALVANPNLPDWIDDIENNVLTWPGITVTTHKYGGLQFNCHGKELGHIHSNGLLDMLLSRKIKQQLMQEDKRVQDHHSFKNSGWISVYMKYPGDKQLAIGLFEEAYKRHTNKELNNRNIV